MSYVQGCRKRLLRTVLLFPDRSDPNQGLNSWSLVEVSQWSSITLSQAPATAGMALTSYVILCWGNIMMLHTDPCNPVYVWLVSWNKACVCVCAGKKDMGQETCRGRCLWIMQESRAVCSIPPFTNKEKTEDERWNHSAMVSGCDGFFKLLITTCTQTLSGAYDG